MVYFIIENGGEFIKIGMSDNPKQRLDTLQRSNPRKLRLVTAICGDYGLETIIHRRFKHIRVEREWFKATDELKSFIQDLHRVENAGSDMLEKATAFTKKWDVPY